MDGLAGKHVQQVRFSPGFPATLEAAALFAPMSLPWRKGIFRASPPQASPSLLALHSLPNPTPPPALRTLSAVCNLLNLARSSRCLTSFVATMRLFAVVHFVIVVSGVAPLSLEKSAPTRLRQLSACRLIVARSLLPVPPRLHTLRIGALCLANIPPGWEITAMSELGIVHLYTP
jgi:hypothetical protein